MKIKMKRVLVFLFVLLPFFVVAGTARAETILFEDFEDNDGFAIGGGPATYWDIAPLSGTVSVPSYFVQGGSQSGNIFFGSRGKGGPSDPAPIMTIDLPSLTNYTNLQMVVSLAAPDCTISTCWEITHRDRLVITDSNGEVDRFRPLGNASPLVSLYGSGTLHYTFADFSYPITDNAVSSFTFEFASTANDEVVGIDSLMILGDPKSPTSKDECKDEGWMDFTNPEFRNQGDCVSYVQSNENAGKRN